MIRSRMMIYLVPLSLVLLLVACNQQDDSSTGTTTPTSTPTATAAPTAAPAAPTAVAPTSAPRGAPSASTGNSNGQEIYDSACLSCHSTGVAGAPKLGDPAAWKDRIAEGMDSLVQSTIDGKGNMPPMGGDKTLSESDIRAAVTYMVDQSR